MKRIAQFSLLLMGVLVALAGCSVTDVVLPYTPSASRSDSDTLLTSQELPGTFENGIDNTEFFAILDAWIAEQIDDVTFFRAVDIWVSEETISLHEGDRNGPFQLEKIFPDHVTGLAFREYPIAIDKGSPVTLQIGDRVSNGCTVNLRLVSIKATTATFIKWTDTARPCPICLAENTLIETPLGTVPVQQLKAGMAIWSVNLAGERIPEIIVKTSMTPVPATHRVVHLRFDDGREVFVSPGHPTIDGRHVGDLKAGQFYNGSAILMAELIPYAYEATYDILPSGETGFYWANGVLLGSTLH
ncbi:hypothetical protein HY229_09590 [Candidatus Acetothermia bacterium]|nr:hypothetical protein [Candidatus Acetothermia bacterium]MBI3644336.1 hypothetical protein [Candidatus Acetothermia bacterium]